MPIAVQTYNSINPFFLNREVPMPELIFGPRKNAAVRKLAMPAIKKADKHPNWGGRRPGSGRKPSGDKPLDAMIVVRMSEKQKAFFKMAGGSAWLRSLLDRCMEKKKENDESGEERTVKELLGGMTVQEILPKNFPNNTGF